jgi:hypothetical protein
MSSNHVGRPQPHSPRISGASINDHVIVDIYPPFPAGFDPRSRLRPGDSPHRSPRSRDESRRMIVDQSTPYQGKFGPRSCKGPEVQSQEATLFPEIRVRAGWPPRWPGGEVGSCFPIRNRSLSRGFRSTMTGAVKVVSMMGGPAPGTVRFTAGCSLGPLKIAETGVRAGFLMIAKGFIPEMGTKSFAIMKGN